MVFSDAVFLFLFLPLVLLVYYNPVFKGRKFKNILLLLVSLFFYAWGEPVFVIVMIMSVIANWFFGLLLVKYKADAKLSKRVLVASVVCNLANLFVFKYLTFVLENLNLLLNQEFFTLHIALPIGISFYTFQAMSYVFDVYRDRSLGQKNVLNVGLYIALFPQLVAGPIVRFETIAYEIDNRKENLKDFSYGTLQFIYGLGKKVIIANTMAIIADRSFGMEAGELSVAMAWMGIAAYTLQIYFDFSGYSDMAIGMGKMLGFHFLKNFDYPYISKSITEFWRRWHMSLGSWFRDYLYFPLGGSRVNTAKLIRNLFVVWLLTGVWHGANWTFVVWGLLYFVLLTAEKLTKFHLRLGNWFGHIYALAFIMIGWVFFRSDSISHAVSYLAAMVGFYSNPLSDSVSHLYFTDLKWFLLLAVLLSAPVLQKLEDKFKDVKAWQLAQGIIAVLILFISVSTMLRSTNNPFIYFNF